MQLADNVFFTTVETIGRNRGVILFVTLSIMLVSVAFAFLAPERFEAGIKFSVITPSSNIERRNLISGFPFSGFVSGQADEVAINLSILSSQDLTQRFLTEYKLLPILYSEKWDEKKQAWSLQENEKEPTLWRANRFFDSKVRRISVDKATQIVELSMVWASPTIAANWANEFLTFADRIIAEKARVETDEKIAFIQQQILINEQSEVKQSLVLLLQEELKKKVLLSTSQAHTFKVIDPAVPPEVKSAPKRGLIIAVGSALGILAGVFVALLKESFQRYRAERKRKSVST